MYCVLNIYTLWKHVLLNTSIESITHNHKYLFDACCLLWKHLKMRRSTTESLRREQAWTATLCCCHIPNQISNLRAGASQLVFFCAREMWSYTPERWQPIQLESLKMNNLPQECLDMPSNASSTFTTILGDWAESSSYTLSKPLFCPLEWIFVPAKGHHWLLKASQKCKCVSVFLPWFFRMSERQRIPVVTHLYIQYINLYLSTQSIKITTQVSVSSSPLHQQRFLFNQVLCNSFSIVQKHSKHGIDTTSTC